MFGNVVVEYVYSFKNMILGDNIWEENVVLGDSVFEDLVSGHL
jgi:hypothetical protein